jgi:phospholipid transport system substrate-binding protein
MTHSKAVKVILALSLTLNLTVSGAAQASDAASPQGAADFVEMLGEQVAAIWVSGNENLSETKRAALRALISVGFELDVTSQFVLGKFWGRAKTEQRAEFKGLFAEYLVNTYANHLNRYRIATLTVDTSNRVAENDFLVQTSIDSASDTANVVWRVRAWDGEYRIIDILIDRISLALTHRSEFASVIQRGGLEKLLQILRKRAPRNADFAHQLSRSERTPRIALPASILVSPDASKLNIVLRQ